jgi:hypothetical protein
MKNITFKEVNPYHSEGDEDNFFLWLQSIDSVKKVTRTAVGLCLSIDNIDRVNLHELLALFTRYSIAVVPLKELLDHLPEEDREWFNKPKAVWYKGLFDE